MSVPLPDPNVIVGGGLDAEGVRRNLEALALATVDLEGLLFVGSGSPNGVVTASPPALYLDRSGGAGTTLYVKESGSGTNTGWVGK